MKKVLTVASIMILSASVASAEVASKTWNVDVFGGVRLSDNLDYDHIGYDLDSGATFGIGLSKSGLFHPNLDLGVELSHSSAEYTNYADEILEDTTAMVTAKYNFINTEKFQVYAGAGLGIVNFNYDQLSGSYDSDTLFGGQATIGGRYRINETIQLYTEGRYMIAEDAVLDVSGTDEIVEYKTKSIVLGLRTSF